MKVIDLSIPLLECDNLVYPGTVYLKIKPVIDYSRNMLLSSNVEIWLHAGTHVDSPSHVIESGSTIEKAPLHKLVHEAVILDLTNAISEDHPIAIKDLDYAEAGLNAQGERIKEGDILILRTDWSLTRLPWNPEYRNNSPYLTYEGAEWLVARKPSAVGFDFPEEKIANLFMAKNKARQDEQTPNVSNVNHPLPVHLKLLGSGIYLVEHLTNLDRLVDCPRFLFVAAPLKIIGVEGTPVRALGIEIQV
jgi:arylformamidase